MEKLSLPARGVWIEMDLRTHLWQVGQMSLPARGVWIEIPRPPPRGSRRPPSLPARGVWIEITPRLSSARLSRVTPREGSVD